MTKKFTIAGGGIAGLTTAIALQRIGINASVLEAAPVIRAVGAGLGLGANAIKALAQIGLADEIISKGRCLDSFIICDEKGKPINTTDSKANSLKYGVDNFTIHRAVLHEFLLSKTDPDFLKMNRRVIGAEQDASGVSIFLQDGSVEKTDFLIVADGIHSYIRQKLLPESVPRYAGYTCWRAIIDNTDLSISSTSETWGPQGRFGIVPLSDNKLYWFACINETKAGSDKKNYRVKDLLQQFGQFHKPIPEILSQTKDENLLFNDILDLKPIMNYAFGRILLIGDAAHGTTPNMGQGACQAMEDAVILMNTLKNSEDPQKAFVEFEKKRLKRTHYIINTSARIGKLAQLENKLACRIRNFLLRSLPARINEKQLEKLNNVQFD
jgi:2-polyprenyl-6-methoxyphenol hydroxylase-like FAD-dependent oxidoreductase